MVLFKFMLNVLVTPQFRKDFVKIAKEISLRSEFAVSVLKLNPTDVSLKPKKLKIGDDLWRVRLGTHRLIYTFNRKSLVLLRIRHRKDVYRGLK